MVTRPVRRIRRIRSHQTMATQGSGDDDAVSGVGVEIGKLVSPDSDQAVDGDFYEPSLKYGLASCANVP